MNVEVKFKVIYKMSDDYGDDEPVSLSSVGERSTAIT
jgi:hypothetical protein